MKKLLFSFLIAVCAAFAFTLYQGGKNCVDAKSYGPTAACPGAPGKTVGDFYPGQTISSVDILISVLSNNLPPGLRYEVTAGAAACSEVRCLTRSDSAISTFLPGDVSTVTLDKIGCGGASGVCNDTLTVTISAYDTITGRSCTWSHSSTGAASSFVSGNSNTVNIANKNGVYIPIYFMLNCTVPSTPAPTPTLTPTKTPTPTVTKTPTPTLTPTKTLTPTRPPIGGQSPTPTRIPTPTFSYSPTPTLSRTPTPSLSVTPPICPVPQTPVVQMNCPACTPN